MFSSVTLTVMSQFFPGRFAVSRQRCCQGVDLNRNYDWHFGVEGSSTNPCSEIYQVNEPICCCSRKFFSHLLCFLLKFSKIKEHSAKK
ncbi:unnamed protein product [Gongylonema pulchrum]|uniref:Peptidase_M14 domain-containing protein n=1 Tax=Gongylonema pulchrum TaxID=637853 RepID=A0A183EWB1_9BILA|nr:unnamed protein product [Gongylonema pulchrum]